MPKSNTAYLQLPYWSSGDDKPIGFRTAMKTAFEGIENEFGQRGVNVKWFGAIGDGVADDTAAIQAAIDGSAVGDIIFFPPGTYMVSSPLIIKEKRTYTGVGLNTTIKQLDNHNIEAIMKFVDNTVVRSGIIIRDLVIDGARSTNILTHGLLLYSIQASRLENVRVNNVPGTAYYLDGNTGAGRATADVELYNCNCYNAGNYGVYLGGCLDTHIKGGDFGLNGYAGIHIVGSSCSIRHATVWASQNDSGIHIVNSSVGCQITDCNVEGHAQHGLLLEGDHIFVSGCKVYDNANVPANYGLFDGICVLGKHNVLVNNIVYSGLYASTGLHRYQINLLSSHLNCCILANDLRYNGNGTIDTTINLVNGLDVAKGDIWDPSATPSNSEVSAYCGTALAIPGSAWTTVVFPNKDIDNLSEYDTETGKFTAQQAGKYNVTITLLWTTRVDGNGSYLSLYKNGTEYQRLAGRRAGGAGDNELLNGSITVTLNKGDYLEAKCYTQGADSLVSFISRMRINKVK